MKKRLAIIIFIFITIVLFCCKPAPLVDLRGFWQVILITDNDTSAYDFKFTQDTVFTAIDGEFWCYETKSCKGDPYKIIDSIVLIYDSAKNDFVDFFKIKEKIGESELIIENIDRYGKKSSRSMKRIIADNDVKLLTVSLNFCNSLYCTIDSGGLISLNSEEEMITDTLSMEEFGEIKFFAGSIPSNYKNLPNCYFHRDVEKFYFLSVKTNKINDKWYIENRIPCYTTRLFACMNGIMCKYFNKHKKQFKFRF